MKAHSQESLTARSSSRVSSRVDIFRKIIIGAPGSSPLVLSTMLQHLGGDLIKLAPDFYYLNTFWKLRQHGGGFMGQITAQEFDHGQRKLAAVPGDGPPIHCDRGACR
jgi:hypothetical protein